MVTLVGPLQLPLVKEVYPAELLHLELELHYYIAFYFDGNALNRLTQQQHPLIAVLLSRHRLINNLH